MTAPASSTPRSTRRTSRHRDRVLEPSATPGSTTTASPSNVSSPTTAPATDHGSGEPRSTETGHHPETHSPLPAPDQRQDRTIPSDPARGMGLHPRLAHRHRTLRSTTTTSSTSTITTEHTAHSDGQPRSPASRTTSPVNTTSSIAANACRVNQSNWAWRQPSRRTDLCSVDGWRIVRVAYFAPEEGDAALTRRVASLQQDGHLVHSFTFSRSGRVGSSVRASWPNTRLGQTKDRAYGHRLLRLFLALPRALRAQSELHQAQVLVARNLDMALLCQVVRSGLRLRRPVVYEVLDIPAVMLADGSRGNLARVLERWVLRRSSVLILSSEAFYTNYYSSVQHFRGRYVVVENKLAASPLSPVQNRRDSGAASAPIRVVWAGGLRCRRSLELLVSAAQQLGNQVTIHFVRNTGR